jgi:tRNA dimethylallyltransferase
LEVIAIGGPTASGKTQVGIFLAKEWGCPILCCDARQVFRELDIGTAKPSWSERKRIPHFLIDICTIEQNFTAWDFRLRALKLIHALSSHYKRLLLIGGTGLYFHALLHGLAPIPPISQKVKSHVQKLWKKGGLPLLQEILQREDPLAWKTIDIQNPARVQRALEVWFDTRKSIVAFWQETPKSPFPYTYTRYYLKPEMHSLKKNIEKRTHHMFQQGWIQEVQILRSKYQNVTLLKNTIGYAEILDCLERKQPITETVVRQIIQRTIQYAKRQITWFNKYFSVAKLVTTPEELIADALSPKG